jgi:hypothetical protein
LLEGDPDDPSTFIKHYQDAWERADFKQVEVTVTPQVRDILSTVPGSADEYRKYVWKEGIFSVEATEIGRGGGWEIYAFINNVAGDPEARSQSAEGGQDRAAGFVGGDALAQRTGELDGGQARAIGFRWLAQ